MSTHTFIKVVYDYDPWLRGDLTYLYNISSSSIELSHNLDKYLYKTTKILYKPSTTHLHLQNTFVITLPSPKYVCVAKHLHNHLKASVYIAHEVRVW